MSGQTLIATHPLDRTGADADREWLRAGLAVAAVAWGANQFAPLLLLYRAELDLTAATVQATFGLYALGLVPGLLLGGPISDRRGRRRVMVPALLASILASGLLLAGGAGVGWLFAGRLVAGLASGAAFSSGVAWIKELSLAAGDGAQNPGPRRATVAMTAGFAAGPLLAGMLAQWAPAATVVPYLPHLVLTAVAVPLALTTRETRPRRKDDGALRPRRASAVRERRFRSVVAPLAPWVFGSAAIALAYLPGLVEDRLGGSALVFGAVVATLTALAGILVQPLARRLDVPGRPRLLGAAMTIVIAGLLVAAAAAATSRPALVVVAALVLGAGYGCCQVCGLLEVQRLAPPDDLAALTAAYQALSYVGFALPFLLASVEGFVPAALGLLVLVGLAVVTLAWTTRAANRTPAERTT